MPLLPLAALWLCGAALVAAGPPRRAQPRKRCTGGWEVVPDANKTELQEAILVEFLVSAEANATLDVWAPCDEDDLVMSLEGCQQVTSFSINYRVWPRFSCPAEGKRNTYITVSLRVEATQRVSADPAQPLDEIAGAPVVLDFDVTGLWEERRIRGPASNDGNFFPGVILEDVKPRKPRKPKPAAAPAPAAAEAPGPAQPAADAPAPAPS